MEHGKSMKKKIPKPSAMLLSDVNQYLLETNTAHTTLARAATGNCRLIRNLREGKTITLTTADKLYQVMARFPNGIKSSDLTLLNEKGQA